MKDKKAAKRIIIVAKKHPNWYSREDVKYAKMVRKRIKREEKQHERETSERNPRSGEAHRVRSKSEQPQESRQSKGSWFVKLLYKARSLVGL